jgi:hypothetical protein
MMKHLMRLLPVLMVAMLMMLIVGCSDDDESTNPVQKQPGDPNDAEFQQMLEALDEVGEFNGEMLVFMLASIDSILQLQGGGWPGRPHRELLAAGVEADSIFFTYHATTQYWYVYYQGEDTNGPETITMTVEDSVQFRHATGPVQWPDSALLTGVNNGILMTYETNLGDTIVANQRLTVTGEILTAGDIVISGTQGFDVYSAGGLGGCTIDLDMASTATALALNIAHTDQGGCPESGVWSHAGAIGLTCVGPPPVIYNESWTINWTFTGSDNYTIVAENSTTRWNYSGNCQDDS